jgi:hypothetical protein
MEGVSEKKKQNMLPQSSRWTFTAGQAHAPLFSRVRPTVFGLRMFSSARRAFVRVNYLRLSAAPFEGCLSAASMLHSNLSQEIFINC